jgi:hypothetical protein
MRFAFKTPRDWDHIEINNGSLTKSVIEYRFNTTWENVKQLRDLGVQSASDPTLATVLRAMGSHTILWIGTYQGTIAPQDVQPEGWTYPSGQAYEPENFWQWYPDDRSAQMLVKDSNSFLDNPMSFMEDPQGIFKSLVPFQIARNQGQTIAVDAIPISRLAGMVRKEVDWVFEVPHKLNVV